MRGRVNIDLKINPQNQNTEIKSVKNEEFSYTLDLPNITTNIDFKNHIVSEGRKAWKTLFTQVFNLTQLEEWEKTIPRYGCDCSNFYKKYKKMYPPPENIGFTWKWKLKNAVNQKLDQPQLSLEEAKAFWANFGVNTDG